MVLKQTLVLFYDLIFILQVGKNYRRCSKCVPSTWLHSLHRRAIACRTLANMLWLCLIWSNAVNIRPVISCLVLTGLMYTTLCTCLQRKKSRGVRCGDLGGHPTGPPLPIHLSLWALFSFVLIDDYTVLTQHRIGQGKGIVMCFHWMLNINKCTVSTKTEVGSSPTLLDSYKHVNKQTEVHTIASHWCTPAQKNIKID